jgi:hypothetical protein
VPPAERELILLRLAPTWLPMSVAEVHYGACEALELADSEVERMGQAVSQRFTGTFLRTFRALGS